MIKTTIAVGLAALALSGCMTAAQQADEDRRFHAAENALNIAQERATVTCEGELVCEKAWRLTKAYVAANSDMQVRAADDTMVDTYAPSNSGMVSLRAMRADTATGATITLTGVCRNMYSDSTGKEMGGAYSACFSRLGELWNGFGPFLKERL